MKNSHASLCVLAYKRPEFLRSCMESLMATSDYPHSIIVNLDGGDMDNQNYLTSLINAGLISSLVINAGGNRGVGRSFANCIGISEGDYIFKIDTDLVFTQGWLSKSIAILDNNLDVGAVSLFDYRHYDQLDTRFNVLETREDCLIVDDFVSSVYGFRKMDKLLDGWGEDDGFHSKLQRQHGKLAITKKDMCRNQGFGVGKSVYVSGTMDHPYKTPTSSVPLILP